MSLRLRVLVFFACVAAATMACAGLLARGVKLQTNVLAMLPPTERDALAEQVVASLGNAIASRAFFVVSHHDEATALRAAEAFAASAGHAGDLAAMARLPEFDPQAPLSLYGAGRFGLLTERDRAALASGKFRPRETALQQLVSPFGQAPGLPLARDPFGFFARWLGSLDAGGAMQVRDGYLVAREGERTSVLVLGRIEGDAYDHAVQDRVLAAFERAAAAARQTAEGVEVSRTGTVFFAAAARGAAMRDMDRIALGSIVGITLVMLFAFRSLAPILLGLLSAGAGILAALLLLIVFEGEVHLITLAFGASLLGETIDYAILICAAHLAAGAAWTPLAGVTQVRPALTIAVATSALAYALLSLLPFPGIAQVARFAVVGLVVSYLTVLWVLPGLLLRPSRRDVAVLTAWAAKLGVRWQRALGERRAQVAALVLITACIPGWLLLEPNDDVRLLVPRDAELSAQDAAIRALSGFDAGGRFFLVRGANEQQVLEREAALVKRLRILESSGALAAHQAVSDFVPQLAVQHADRALVERQLFADREGLQRALLQAGFRADAVKTYVNDFTSKSVPVTVQDWLGSPLSAPLRHLWAPAGPGTPASVVVLIAERDRAAVAQAATELEGVTLVDKAGNVSALLALYRSWAAPGMAAAALVMWLVLLVRYGARSALRVMLPVGLGEAASVALFGYAGVPVTLFAVLGWTVTLGIGINYAIFLREGVGRPGATTMAVVLSASTTLLGFGLLALSGVPALRHFGLALASGIVAAFALAPLAVASPAPPGERA